MNEYVFSEDVMMYGVTAFKYELSPATYNRTIPTYEDCHRGYPILPNGLCDVSACNFGKSFILIIITENDP